jgi:hypothetical protein
LRVVQHPVLTRYTNSKDGDTIGAQPIRRRQRADRIVCVAEIFRSFKKIGIFFFRKNLLSIGNKNYDPIGTWSKGAGSFEDGQRRL